jgi:radical SAM superfamily enzyme YgiQ (UPF0313 family)
MELPCREWGDEMLSPGELADLRLRLRNLSPRHDLTTVIACAFDHRTRILPFIGCDLRIVPAGVRAIGSAMADVGCTKTRIVLQQWNKNFRPSQMRLDGRIPDLFMVSSMHLHSASCDRLIQDACQIDAERRPLIIVGGPRVIYEPWRVFSPDPENPWGADVAVTGEEYVLLSLLETLFSMRAGGESMRSTFFRARDGGALDEIPGLVYSRSETPNGPIQELVDTGIQRLLGDFNELPSPVLGYGLLEPPSRESTLAPRALTNDRIHKHCLVSTVVMTAGCRFGCPYCPIPAYNQRQFRVKSGERVADEMEQIANTYGITNFFGTDDNFFNDPKLALDIAETLASRTNTGKRPYCKIRWATEATIHDTIRMRQHLPVMRQAGLRALWLGVEDLTGSLVNKGQSEEKTLNAFRILRKNGIHPVPMLMHHDSQPLVTWKSNYGLLNQLRILRKAGALYTQILMLAPSPGSKWYENTYTSGLAIQKVNGVPIEPHIVDGNYVIASKLARPWIKQLNLLVGYTYFFNPLRLLIALIRSKSVIPFADAETRPPEEMQHYSPWKRLRRRIYLKVRAKLIDAGVQTFGMYGLLHTYRRTLKWTWHLLRGKIQHYSEAPASQIPMRNHTGGLATHALPDIPVSKQGQDSLEVLGTSLRREAA